MCLDFYLCELSNKLKKMCNMKKIVQSRFYLETEKRNYFMVEFSTKFSSIFSPKKVENDNKKREKWVKMIRSKSKKNKDNHAS
jgi:hypothetical protein